MTKQGHDDLFNLLSPSFLSLLSFIHPFLSFLLSFTGSLHFILRFSALFFVPSPPPLSSDLVHPSISQSPQRRKKEDENVAGDATERGRAQLPDPLLQDTHLVRPLQGLHLGSGKAGLQVPQ